jgi:hypothetical protein
VVRPPDRRARRGTRRAMSVVTAYGKAVNALAQLAGLASHRSVITVLSRRTNWPSLSTRPPALLKPRCDKMALRWPAVAGQTQAGNKQDEYLRSAATPAPATRAGRHVNQTRLSSA